MLVALLLQAALPQAAPPDAAAFERDAWGRFSRGQSLIYSAEEVVVANDRRDGDDGRTRHHRLRLTTRKTFGAPVATFWTDTRACPAARIAVERFGAVPMPIPDPPRQPEVSRSGRVMIRPPIVDGTGYAVTLPVGYRRGSLPYPATFQSNVGTPLASWVDASFAALRACWPDAPAYATPVEAGPATKPQWATPPAGK